MLCWGLVLVGYPPSLVNVLWERGLCLGPGSSEQLLLLSHPGAWKACPTLIPARTGNRGQEAGWGWLALNEFFLLFCGPLDLALGLGFRRARLRKAVWGQGAPTRI